MSTPENFFSEEDEKKILEAIGQAERNTSGEIRVRVEVKSAEDPMQSARTAFKALGMRNTELHSGVLFFLSSEDRRFVILGDDGINEKVPGGFWDSVRDAVIGHFKGGRFADGLAEGIKMAGQQLSEFFPHQKDDVNELPDAISYG